MVLATLLLSLLLSMAHGSEGPTIVPSYVGQRDASLGSSPVITVGVAGPLTGELSWLGWQEANSVQLAISETNAAGGVNIGGITYTLILVAADDQCDPTQAITAANTLLSADAVTVVGHACSAASMPAQSIYHAAGVPMVSPSATNPEVTQQGYNTTFRTVPHDGSPPSLLATYFGNWLGLSRSAIVERAEWVQWASDAYSDTFTLLGGLSPVAGWQPIRVTSCLSSTPSGRRIPMSFSIWI
jgi:branched-chain amino acid transport system substrate-binding protein